MAFERRDFGPGNATATTITAQLTAGATVSFAIAASTNWPDGTDGNFFVALDPTTDLTNPNATFEVIKCSTRSGLTVNIAANGRGAMGTSDATHASGARAWVIGTTQDLDEANYWVAELAAAINTAGDLPVADASNSLTTLAKGANNRVLKVNGAGTLGYAQVDSDDLAAGAIDLAHMSANSVDSDQYVDGSIDLIHMSANSVDSDQYVDGSIDGIHIANDAIDSQHYADGSIDTAHIADAQVTLGKLATAAKADVASFSRTGTLTTGTGTMRFRFPFAATLQHTRLSVGTAPTGAAILVDIHLNGTTVYTTQANRPTIAISANAETATTAPDVTAIAAGDYLTVDIDQVGSTVAGADLLVNVYYVLA